jgi:hypothetical protein
MRRKAAAIVFVYSVLAAACSRSARTSPAATFTAAPASTSAGARPPAPPPHPVVAANCLRSLSSYRFSGSFALVNGAATATAQSGESPASAGSLSNLLSNVTFQGAALAPDRYQAQITFGGGGVQPLDVLRIADKTYSRFGNSAWQIGDQIRGLGGISAFDPQTLCERVLAPVDTRAQQPEHETVNGVSSLRYELSGPQVARAFRGLDSGGASPRAPSVTPTANVARLTVWAAEHGGYPVRFELESESAASKIALHVDVTDINGRDIQISPPS